MATILVLVHPHDRFFARSFLVSGLFQHWARMGHTVHVHAGTEGAPAADVALLHVDLSVVPEPYLQLLRRYPVTLNGGTADIRKRRISLNLVEAGDDWQGPVVVKTDLNAGGTPEWGHQQVEARQGRAVASPIRPMTGRYPVFASKVLVPTMVWRDPALVVERFLPERDPRGYYLRNWVFFGDHERCNRALGTEPIVKADDVRERVPVPVPDELRAHRARLGFDYGKFDFVLHEGRPVLIDVNRTPAHSARMATALEAGMADLALGIEAFLR
jgi:hypothetical protein